ncbi:MAG: aspartate aminotransferase family protein [Luteolibacter sp.]
MLPSLQTSVPGPRSVALAERLGRVECRSTTLANPDWPIFWERASGVNVWDADGNRFIDLTSAFGVAGLGHGFSAAAAQTQASDLVHAMGDVHPARLKVELCEKLSTLTFQRWTGQPGKVLLGNSGFEAIEAALKTATLATGRHGIVSFTGGYHGLGYGALLGAGIPWFREPFDAQLAPVTSHLPYPRLKDEDSIGNFREALSRIDGKTVAAVLVEPFQGRGGIVVPHPTFLAELRAWCDANGAMLILDEVYTGFHRTGKFFACEWENVVPDLICLGKALSGGFPISACVGKAGVMDAWPETHGEALHTSTFLGNPLGCAMALTSLEAHASPETADLVAKSAAAFEEALAPLRELPIVHEIRGPGLMKGIELRLADGSLAGDIAIRAVTALLKEGIILLPDAPEGHVIALTPPFTLTREEMDFCVEKLMDALRSV